MKREFKNEDAKKIEDGRENIKIVEEGIKNIEEGNVM